MSDAQSPPTRGVCIIGGGYSGTILAAELARRGIGCWLVEGGGRLARGIAYSTAEPAHLLNVRARNMSAFAGEPDHFLRRFEAIGGEPDGFAERRFYGAYLEDILAEAESTGHVAPVEGEAISARLNGACWDVVLADGRRLRSSALVLAIGNEAPAGLAALAGLGEQYLANPWGGEARRAVAAASDKDVLIVGTGLTMIDTVLSLDEGGFSGRIVALSRRGLTPRPQGPSEPAPVVFEELPKGSVRAMVRWLRSRSARVGWRAAVESLRPHSHALWQSFALDEQRRFLRHARPWWDVHRHRIAPQIARRLADLVAEGRLEIVAGRILVAREEEGGITVEVARRGGRRRTQRFGLLINCTGPLHAMSRTANPLLRSLLDSGAAKPDALDIGLDVQKGATVAGSQRLWALGSLTKGRYWEIIAVPDIRVQAAEVAAAIAEELAE
jgi:uncharacterized NAD(P)/FAD-binding protein YdhS